MTAEEILYNGKHLFEDQIEGDLKVYKRAIIAAMEEYASERTKELEKENERLRALLHDHNNMCQGKLTQQLNEILPEIKSLKAENARLREALEKVKSYSKIGRLPESLMNIIESALSSVEENKQSNV